jgi:chromosome segregation ATPase
LPYSDLAETLQARILANLGRTARDCHCGLEAHIAALEEAVAKAETLAEQHRQDAETAAKRVEALEVHVAALKDAVAKAVLLSEQRLQEAQRAGKRADDLVAELVALTTELVKMSKRLAEQTSAMDKLRTEFDDYRSRSWWWQHAAG